MDTFNPDEKLDHMLGKMSLSLACESADLHAKAYAETNPELSGLWVQVRDSISGRLAAEIAAQDVIEAERVSELSQQAKRADAAYLKAKGK